MENGKVEKPTLKWKSGKVENPTLKWKSGNSLAKVTWKVLN